MEAIRFLRDRPVCMSCRSLESWVIFVDGACEGDLEKQGAIGAVPIDPSGNFKHHISEVVPDFFMEKCAYSKNPIYELEILPQLVSLMCWGKMISQSQCVFYGECVFYGFFCLKRSCNSRSDENVISKKKILKSVASFER